MDYLLKAMALNNTVRVYLASTTNIANETKNAMTYGLAHYLFG